MNGPVTPFTREEFDAAWTDIVLHYKNLGKDSIVVTLSKRAPILQEDYKIVLSIDNKTQEGGLEREKQDLLEMIRKKLNNFAITLETIIEDSGDDTFLYTNKDKFKKMAEKNPHLILLQKRLNLDIDF